MQFSKSNSQGMNLIERIQKLKTQINNVSQYQHLQKCSSKLSRLKEKASSLLQKKKRKQIRQLIDVAEGLIHLKSKKFKKRIIEKITKGHIGHIEKESNSKQKTLMYSKSMDNFDFTRPPPAKIKPKNEQEDSWQDRSEVHPRNNNLRLQKKVEQLQEEVLSYKKKMTKIEEGKTSASLSQLCYRLGQQQGLFQQQLGFKLREKALEIDQLKQKNRRSDQKNQQLKNRLQNEQKRQQDYIKNLKDHINNISLQLESSNRQNKKLQEQINKVYYVCDGYKSQVKKLMQEVDYLQRQRRKLQQNEVLKLKDNTIKRELQNLQLQQKYLRDIESMLQFEKDQNKVLIEKIEQLQKRNAHLQQENNETIAESEKLQQMLEIKAQEILELKKELFECLNVRNKCQQELANSRSIISDFQNEIYNLKKQKTIDLQKKAQNLKHIKELLESK